MSDVKPKYKGSFLRPLKALQFLFQDAETLPMELRPASKNYRGFHLNDWDKCIGCGTCQEICDNHAIRMVTIPELPTDDEAGIKPRRPAIDYGRCCWCALCVDICPTGSISMSREYVHISRDLDSFMILPDEKGMHGEAYEYGWAKTDDADLLDHARKPMAELPADQRSDNFDEIVDGFDDQAALLEASRCIQCGMCHDACPAGMHAPEYIRAIWQGDLEEAVRQIYRTNPFPHVCGRVCTHRCEDACSVGRRGEPVAIRWLKRFAMDGVDHETTKTIALACASIDKTGRKVAIVGAGPAGLTAAFDLARLGHSVTVYDAKPEPGGMMRYGIPEYRLPYDKLNEDIDMMRAAGVDIRCGVKIGIDVAFEELKANNDAVLIATGLGDGRSTRIPGADHQDVVLAVDHLDRITRGDPIEAPERIVVIGGGNVAFDIARSFARLQKVKYGRVNVTLTALEARDGMLADETEVVEADEEGLVLHNSRGPKRVIVEDDRIKGLETVKCVSIFDEGGRFHPKYDEDNTMIHEADLIVEAIGQSSDLSYLGDALIETLDWNGRRIAIDADGRTSEPWLWAAGDLVEGPDVIHAIAAGHRAAESINSFISVHAEAEA